MIRNPILPGFNPDPCICRKGDDYYMAVSSFEWFPGIPVYHSKDLKNWELLTHVLTNDTAVETATPARIPIIPPFGANAIKANILPGDGVATNPALKIENTNIPAALPTIGAIINNGFINT